MFCCNLFFMLLFWHAVFMTVMSSSLGMLVYMFEISREASFSFWLYGISARLLMSWTVFLTLKLYDSGMRV
jgi:hypothetical protein